MNKVRLLFLVIVIAVLPTVTLAQSTIQADFKSYMGGKKIKFSTKGQPKAHGLIIEFDVPQNWTKKEGERSHIVQKFSSPGDGGSAKVAILNITPVPSNLRGLSEKELSEILFDPSQIERQLPKSSKLITAKPTTYDNEPGIFIYYVTQLSRSGVDLASLMVSHRCSFIIKIL